MLRLIYKTSESVERDAFNHTLFPFVRYLVWAILAGKRPEDADGLRAVAAKIVLQYKLAFLGTEPAPSGTWCQTRTRDRWSCTMHGCPACGALDRFIAADEEVARSTMKQPDRTHILRQLNIRAGKEDEDQYKTDYRVNTIKTQTPHTLWVSKTRKAYERSRNDWRLRVQEAKRYKLGLTNSGTDRELRSTTSSPHLAITSSYLGPH